MCKQKLKEIKHSARNYMRWAKLIVVVMLFSCASEAKEPAQETNPVIYCTMGEQDKEINPEWSYDCRDSELSCKNEMDDDEKCMPVSIPMYCMETSLWDEPAVRDCFSTDDVCIKEAGGIKEDKELEREGLVGRMPDLLQDCFVLKGSI